jgi:protein TonB
MSLRHALLISALLHLALVMGRAPTLSLSDPPTPRARFTLRISPQAEPDLVSSVSTQAVLRTEPSATTPPVRSDTARRSQTLAQHQLTRHLYYPEAAVRAGLEGETILLLEISSQGTVTRIQIARTSGHAILDTAAQEAAAKLAGLPRGNGSLLLPVEFRLD